MTFLFILKPTHNCNVHIFDAAPLFE